MAEDPAIAGKRKRPDLTELPAGMEAIPQKREERDESQVTKHCQKKHENSGSEIDVLQGVEKAKLPSHSSCR